MIMYDWAKCPAATSDYDTFGPLAYEPLGFGPYEYVSQRATGERAEEPLDLTGGGMCMWVAVGALAFAVLGGGLGRR